MQTFVEVKSTRSNKHEDKTTLRYYISSIELRNYKQITKAIRSHWCIENQLHWKLDVAMREDDCRIHHPLAAENFSTLRKLVLRLLENENRVSGGIAFKQWKAALSTEYLKKVIGF